LKNILEIVAINFSQLKNLPNKYLLDNLHSGESQLMTRLARLKSGRRNNTQGVKKEDDIKLKKGKITRHFSR
jgi:hypothetical protein